MQSSREGKPHLNEDKNKNKWVILHRNRGWLSNSIRRNRSVYLHKASDVLLFLQEVLIEPAPVGDELEYLSLPEEGVFALLLAPAASAAIGVSGQGDDQGWPIFNYWSLKHFRRFFAIIWAIEIVKCIFSNEKVVKSSFKWRLFQRTSNQCKPVCITIPLCWRKPQSSSLSRST